MQLTRSIVESWARLALDRPPAGRQKIGGNFWTVERFTLDHGLIPWYLLPLHIVGRPKLVQNGIKLP